MESPQGQIIKGAILGLPWPFVTYSACPDIACPDFGWLGSLAPFHATAFNEYDALPIAVRKASRQTA